MAVKRITAQHLKRLMDAYERPTVLDTRSPEAWKSSSVQIPGSIRVPPDEVDQDLSAIRRDRLAVAYCTCPSEHSSARVAQTLVDAGWPDARALLGGLEAWHSAGYPLEPKSADRQPARQLSVREP